MKYAYLSQQTNFGQYQRGAVLILSLILLVVMTLFGLASMNTSVMQEKMARNAQNTKSTFQAAESAVSFQIQQVLAGNKSQLTEAMKNKLSHQSSQVAVNLNNPKLAASYQTTYLGEIVLDIGNSQDVDEGTTMFKNRRYEVTGTGIMTDVQAQTIVRQGIEYR